MHVSCIKIITILTKAIVSYDPKRQLIDTINNIKNIDAKVELLHVG